MAPKAKKQQPTAATPKAAKSKAAPSRKRTQQSPSPAAKTNSVKQQKTSEPASPKPPRDWKTPSKRDIQEMFKLPMDPPSQQSKTPTVSAPSAPSIPETEISQPSSPKLPRDWKTPSKHDIQKMFKLPMAPPDPPSQQSNTPEVSAPSAPSIPETETSQPSSPKLPRDWKTPSKRDIQEMFKLPIDPPGPPSQHSETPAVSAPSAPSIPQEVVQEATPTEEHPILAKDWKTPSKCDIQKMFNLPMDDPAREGSQKLQSPHASVHSNTEAVELTHEVPDIATTSESVLPNNDVSGQCESQAGNISEHQENMIGKLKRVDAEQVPQEVESHSKETYAPALACHATEARDQDGDGDQEAAHVCTQASNMQVDQSMQHAPANATASTTDNLEQTERQQYQGLNEQQQRRRKHVSNLMRWPERMLDTLCKTTSASHEEGQEYQEHIRSDLLRKVFKSINGLHISTAFSGIDTPSIAIQQISLATASCMGIQLDERARCRNLYGIEWYSKSQDILIQMPDGPECLFGDMSDFWQPELKSRVDTLLQNGNFVEVVKKLMQTTDVFSMVKRSGFCIKCQKQCEDPRQHIQIGSSSLLVVMSVECEVLLHLSVDMR